VEVSQDGLEWKEIDRRLDCEELNGPDRSATFTIGTPVESRFVRIRALATHNSGLALEMKKIEFFGILSDEPSEQSLTNQDGN
jgi:hypothetical protein